MMTRTDGTSTVFSSRTASGPQCSVAGSHPHQQRKHFADKPPEKADQRGNQDNADNGVVGPVHGCETTMPSSPCSVRSLASSSSAAVRLSYSPARTRQMG